MTISKKSEGKKMAKNDTHFYGDVSRCGYDRLPDGGFSLAPSLENGIERMLAEIEAVKMFVDNVSDFAQKRYKQVNEDKKRWWKEIIGDLKPILGEKAENLIYKGGRIYVKEEETDTPLPAPPKEEK